MLEMKMFRKPDKILMLSRDVRPGPRLRPWLQCVLAASLWFAHVLPAFGLSEEISVTPKSLDQGTYVFSISTNAVPDGIAFHVTIAAKTNDVPSDCDVGLSIVTNWPGGSQISGAEPSVNVTLTKEGRVWQADFTVPREQLKNPGLCFVFTEPSGFVVNGKKIYGSATFYEIKLQDFLKP